MIIGAQGSGPRLDPELEKLARQLEDAHAGLASSVDAVLTAPQVAARVRPQDGYEAAGPRAASGPVSSAAPRERGSGMAAHEVFASQGTLGAESVDATGRPFAWDSHADTSIDRVSTRRLLNYYDGSMRALHGTLGQMDFARKEEFWYERYREDERTDADRDYAYYSAMDDYADRSYYDAMEADRIALEYDLSTRSYYDYEDLDR